MGIVSPKLLSIYFIALPIFATLWFVTKIFKHRVIDGTIQNLNNLPDERKKRIIRLYKNIISTWRINLFLTPITLLLFFAIFVFFGQFPELLSGFPDTDIRKFLLLGMLLLIVAFIHFLEDSYYKKKILKAIEKKQES